MTRHPLRSLALSVLVLAVSACGFQLRDALTLPPDLGPVRVVSVDRYSPLAESLSQSIERAGATLAGADSGDEVVVLDLLSEQWGDTPISVDAFGRSQEFSLRYAVIFELRAADGSAIVPRQTIELARDYVSNPTNSIGTEGEREILQRELRREMAASVLRRIDTVARRAVTTAATAPPPSSNATATGLSPEASTVTPTDTPVEGTTSPPPPSEPTSTTPPPTPR
ncbi:LPS-assembly lipoprotein LptE [Cognatilysobacter tabacisoli]|uniref:LPS-assembly lipoprotein LptE n=1 Tax=Cognatilysobacter tabacisoli TaxID=2315424 RepID=UPI000E6B3AD5|nr:LPS assembly lipoprotein LptE [Lysobacter tabacisoli]